MAVKPTEIDDSRLKLAGPAVPGERLRYEICGFAVHSEVRLPIPELTRSVEFAPAWVIRLHESDVPAPLKPWIGWVLHDHDERRCPLSPESQRLCTWPAELLLSLSATGGSGTGYSWSMLVMPQPAPKTEAQTRSVSGSFGVEG